MEDLTGMQLGPYRIVAALGEGGMAAVYRAYQPGIDRYVAVKVLPRQLAQNPQFVERFQHEARLIARLVHPYILPIHDFGQAEGYTYLVMPFIEGGTLKDILTGRPLPLMRTRSVIRQLADALDCAHSLGVVHRDLKPSNVLIDPRGNCLLTDFGIARMVEGASRLTQTGAILGTPAYMSPEQGRGERVDQRSDIYSLGVMLYEMATGRVPFNAETPVAIIFKHIQDPLPPPRALNPALPEAVERVIFKAMAKDPADRYQTAGDMAQALGAGEAAVSSAVGPGAGYGEAHRTPPSPDQSPPAQPPSPRGLQRPGVAPVLSETLHLPTGLLKSALPVTVLLIAAAVLLVALTTGGIYALAPVVRTLVAPRGTTPPVATSQPEFTQTPLAQTLPPTPRSTATNVPPATATLALPTPQPTATPIGTSQPLATPEGFHDGAEGVVSAPNCTAFGWAVDPNKRDGHVLVRILADGNAVASAYARDYGQDLDKLGKCTYGLCRFTISLVGLIAVGEKHLIVVQAYDEETAEWFNLLNTPKSLTCQA